MIRLFFSLLVLSVTLLARYDASAVQSCLAYNNLKHTNNTHNIALSIGKTYTILQEHKGQFLVLISGENPAQRWVDENCFSLGQSTPSQAKPTQQIAPSQTSVATLAQTSSTQNLFVLSWHNAFCQMHAYKPECKRSLFSFGDTPYREKHFVLHGLWPQPQSNSYCNVPQDQIAKDKHHLWNQLPTLNIDEQTQKALKEVMPGFASQLHKHEWIKHGTCFGTDANTYFKTAASLTQQFNNSKVGQFFTDNIGKKVTLQQVRFLLDREFGKGSGQKVEMKCTKGMITEIWMHIGSGSDDLGTLLQRGERVRSRCLEGFVDRAGF